MMSDLRVWACKWKPSRMDGINPLTVTNLTNHVQKMLGDNREIDWIFRYWVLLNTSHSLQVNIIWARTWGMVTSYDQHSLQN